MNQFSEEIVEIEMPGLDQNMQEALDKVSRMPNVVDPNGPSTFIAKAYYQDALAFVDTSATSTGMSWFNEEQLERMKAYIVKR